MLNRLVTGAFVVATAGIGIVAAQHTGQHQSPAHDSRTDHAICGVHHAVAAQAATQHPAAPATATPHHATASAQQHAAAATQHHAATAAASSPVETLAAELKLTAQQAAEIDRLATEACAAMAKYHEQVLAVLTPEQRAKMQALHGGTDAESPLAAFFRKLHGGVK
jgi:Spy/CpxP family protein refolding chaperone